MQLIWVSGPTAKVVTVSITLKKVLAGLGLMALFFAALGFVFHFIGLRVAVEYSPALVQSIGGVTSKSELERMEAGYRAQLADLQSQVDRMLQTVRDLEHHKKRMADLIGWDAGRDRLQPSVFGGRAGQGGPLNLLPFLQYRSVPLDSQLLDARYDMQSLSVSLDQLHSRWQGDYERLKGLPVSLPLQEPFAVTSGFGFRLDPITRFPSLHEGLDFVAEVGAPVKVTAPGVVVRSEYSGAYGQMVEVEHAEGYATRYAHLGHRHVQPGQTLQRGEVVGLLGNTGRSTGPHLHYEILRHGRALRPDRAFQSLDRI